MSDATVTPTRRISRRARRALVLGAVVVGTGGAIALSQGTANAATPPATAYHVTSSSSTFNGGCRVSADVWYYPNTDHTDVTTTITSPYLFAACRAHTNVRILGHNLSWSGASQASMACAVLDPSCASTRSYSGGYNGTSPGIAAQVASVNGTLAVLGLPPLDTPANEVTGVAISFTNG